MDVLTFRTVSYFIRSIAPGSACRTIRKERTAHAVRSQASDLRVVTGAGPWSPPGTGPLDDQQATVAYDLAVFAAITGQHEDLAALTFGGRPVPVLAS